jgi:hypothetical protein
VTSSRNERGFAREDDQANGPNHRVSHSEFDPEIRLAQEQESGDSIGQQRKERHAQLEKRVIPVNRPAAHGETAPRETEHGKERG